MKKLLNSILANNELSNKNSTTDFTKCTDNELITILETATDDKKVNAIKEVMNRKTSNHRLSKLKERIAICIEEI